MCVADAGLQRATAEAAAIKLKEDKTTAKKEDAEKLAKATADKAAMKAAAKKAEM